MLFGACFRCVYERRELKSVDFQACVELRIVPEGSRRPPGSWLVYSSEIQGAVELGLVPASLLNFTWHPDIEQDIASQGNALIGFLRPELKQ